RLKLRMLAESEDAAEAKVERVKLIVLADGVAPDITAADKRAVERVAIAVGVVRQQYGIGLRRARLEDRRQDEVIRYIEHPEGVEALTLVAVRKAVLRLEVSHFGVTERDRVALVVVVGIVPAQHVIDLELRAVAEALVGRK